jgi:hypothetical protein
MPGCRKGARAWNVRVLLQSGLHPTSGADGGQAKDARTALGEVRPPSGCSQDKATKDQVVAAASADVKPTLELQQATMAFESGDVAVAARLKRRNADGETMGTLNDCCREQKREVRTMAVALSAT